MDSWSAPAASEDDLPHLPGTGRPLALYDTARRGVHPTRPASGRATMYVCGITPYDAAHLGHAATMIAFDLVNRMWVDAGHTVQYVQNVTDIDDPLLERAARDGEDWKVLAMRETALFREDMEALRILPPTHYIGAVESIPAIAAKVVELLERGVAYRLKDGTQDVYFDLSSSPSFGYESNLDRAAMLELSAERGGDPDRPGKRDPLDPLLWRGMRPEEPAWDGGPLGPGRPGWHIECTVIAQSLLGDTIDVQGGGNDLIFPHHECSAAHGEVLTGKGGGPEGLGGGRPAVPFAAHYVHAGMIGLNGEKMSKSRGNLVFASRLRADGIDPMAVRLALMAEHYREDRPWTDELLKSAEIRLARWRAAAATPAGPSGADLLDGLRARLSHDLDTPAALALVDTWAEDALTWLGNDTTAPALMRSTVDHLLGIRL